MDAVDALCPECAKRERTQALQPSHHALPPSRLSAAKAAMGDPPIPGAGGSGSGSGSAGGARSSKSLRRERGASGAGLGKTGGKKDRGPAGRSSPQARAASPAGIHSSEVDRRDSERESAATTNTKMTTTTTTSTPGRSRTEGGAVREEQGGGGRAAAMSDLYEFRGGMGGALQWLKDRVSDTVAGGRRGDERRAAAKWQGVD